MNTKVYYYIALGVCMFGMTLPTFAGFTVGDPKLDTGAFTISGTLRAKYNYKDYGADIDPDNSVQFDAAILNLGYDSPKVFGSAQWRCYQWSDLCDFSTLVSAYAGYRLNQTDHLTFGLQPVPFGPDRYWDSSFYAGLNYTLGLQDVLNLGLNYHTEFPSATKVDLAYFIRDGGNYTGTSNNDTARYSANTIKTDNAMMTSLKEKDMFVTRISQDLNFSKNDDLNVKIGGSYWYSKLDNQRNDQEGTRKIWSLFNTIHYQNMGITLTAGQMKIDNKDSISTYSTFGSFDSEYNIANKGTFYSVDMNYVFNNVKGDLNVTPYIVLSGLKKDEDGFKNSQRNILGVAWNHKNISVYTEYVMSKNDIFIGGNVDSLAKGDDDQWNKLFNMVFIYNF
ncbi:MULTISPECIES: hypothetical protein [unclassified Acinetobacter]|uniref:hypothetical protein n=1 Tax=unclassified Acinetobacter TaxID=196816 RepID=UPI00190C63FE|nr:MULTISPECIES: hypothetical protein [unclassified Acinetobacter]MBK0062330.1 hypothetical protein [Acinetobacter sp. S55]MBK0066134.1 hypothetical protein [Acinetobacter sp. S54]